MFLWSHNDKKRICSLLSLDFVTPSNCFFKNISEYIWLSFVEIFRFKAVVVCCFSWCCCWCCCWFIFWSKELVRSFCNFFHIISNSFFNVCHRFSIMKYTSLIKHSNILILKIKIFINFKHPKAKPKSHVALMYWSYKNLKIALIII